MTGLYHYTECGLDYIYLGNGFERQATPYGDGVSIKNADGLHAAIAREIIGSPRALRGQEVRFLRSLLEISQEGLGDVLGLSRATVARWEAAGDEAISGAADRALRLYFALRMGGHDAERIIELFARIDERKHEDVVFNATDTEWQREAA